VDTLTVSNNLIVCGAVKILDGDKRLISSHANYSLDSSKSSSRPPFKTIRVSFRPRAKLR
jgi:hypothetical protein